MTPAREQRYSEARQREHDVMVALARAVLGQKVIEEGEPPDTLRQLGYAAYLVRGRVDDPQDCLGQLALHCMKMVEHAPMPEVRFRDSVQARWGAPYGMDVHKLRTELPLHIRRLASQAAENEQRGSPSADFEP